MNEAELKILEMIQAGDITAEEGFRLIDAMGFTAAPDSDLHDEIEPEEKEVFKKPLAESASNKKITQEHLRIKFLKHWWLYPFSLGILMMILGTIWISLSYSKNGFNWHFLLAGFVLLIGLLFTTLSFPTQKRPWLHVRIKNAGGAKPKRIFFSVPLFIPLTNWLLKTFGSVIPQFSDKPFEDWIGILDSLSLEEPFYVQANAEGNQVEVFIG